MTAAGLASIGACILATLGLVHSEHRASSQGIAVFKMTAATAYLGLGIASGALEAPAGRILFIGLCLCWIGDALLLSPGRSKRFQLGLGAFLLGHVAYTASFFVRGLSGAGLFVAGLFVAGAAVIAISWLRPHLRPGERIAVTSYLGVISLMVAAAFGCWLAGAPVSLALGAAGFALSDLAVARDRFISADFANAAWGLPLYFASQCLLASSSAAQT